MVIATKPMTPEDIKGKRIAIPGKMTTAYLALKIFEQDFEPVVIPFDKIPDAVQEHSVDAGLVIHEAQLTYGRGGFHNVLDLGRWWKKTYDMPLPLGANALLRSLEPEIQTECCRLMRESIQYALDNHEEALNYAMQFARGHGSPSGREVCRHVREPLHSRCRGYYPESCTTFAGHGLRSRFDSAPDYRRIHPITRHWSNMLRYPALVFLFLGLCVAASPGSKPLIKEAHQLGKQGSQAIVQLVPMLKGRIGQRPPGSHQKPHTYRHASEPRPPHPGYSRQRP